MELGDAKRIVKHDDGYKCMFCGYQSTNYCNPDLCDPLRVEAMALVITDLEEQLAHARFMSAGWKKIAKSFKGLWQAWCWTYDYLCPRDSLITAYKEIINLSDDYEVLSGSINLTDHTKLRQIKRQKQYYLGLLKDSTNKTKEF